MSHEPLDSERSQADFEALYFEVAELVRINEEAIPDFRHWLEQLYEDGSLDGLEPATVARLWHDAASA